MTTQRPDEVCFAGKWFALTAVDGTGLFDPDEHGLEPQAMSSGCWRGYVCWYSVVERRLVLRDLELGSETEPPEFGAVSPQGDEEYFTWRYQDLNTPVAFTGRLLVGDGDIDDRPYLNMGFRPAWMYRDIHELTFQDGNLLTATDCSADLAAVRDQLVAVGVQPGPDEPTRDWISRTFSLTYDYSWPGRP